jgi:rod shape-determining protein MreC
MALSRRSPRLRGRSRFTLILLVLTAISLLTLDIRGFGPLESARGAVQSFFSPVGETAGRILSPVGDAWNGARGYGDLEEENARLRQRIDELESEKAAAPAAQQELDALKAQLSIPFVGQIPTARARVSSGAIGNFEETIEIDKGASSGIRRSMVVVSGAGLVGTVESVSDSRSVVRLATNRDFRVGVRAPGKTGIGIATGTGEARRMTANFELTDTVEVGDTLITTGTSTSRFPPDIPVGKITDIHDDPNGNGREAYLDLLANLTDLHFVTVLLWEPPA